MRLQTSSYDISLNLRNGKQKCHIHTKATVLTGVHQKQYRLLSILEVCGESGAARLVQIEIVCRNVVLKQMD